VQDEQCISGCNLDPSAKNVSKTVLMNPPRKRTGGFGYLRPLCLFRKKNPSSESCTVFKKSPTKKYSDEKKVGF
jgi:hypothetical protein